MGSFTNNECFEERALQGIELELTTGEIGLVTEHTLGGICMISSQLTVDMGKGLALGNKQNLCIRSPMFCSTKFPEYNLKKHTHKIIWEEAGNVTQNSEEQEIKADLEIGKLAKLIGKTLM